MWLSKVEASTGKKVSIDWQPFSLVQANSDKGDDFKYWEQPEALDGTDTTLLAHRAGLAAKRQGEEAFDAFFMALLKLRHEEKQDLMDPEVINQAVTIAGIDKGQFQEDLLDPSLLEQIGASHTKAVEEYGVFGVPTYVSPSGNAAFVKMFKPPDEESAKMYETIKTMVSEHKHVGEIKRPQPPWPQGII